MHIVIVDPSRVALKVISGLLVPEGHKVQTFTDSREALAALSDDPSVDALITSLEVRPLTGLELCWEARLLGDSRRPVYVLAMSSLQNPRNLSEALDSGADDFIGKPPSPEELRARLRAGQRLITMQRDLIRLAETDPATGLLNRRAFLDRLRDAGARAGAFGRLTLTVVDLDGFKQVNEAHGEDVGDGAIRAVAHLLAQEQGFAGRLGGEEFALACPHRLLDEACDAANRLRAQIAQVKIRGSRGPLKLTASLGVSAWSEGETPDGLLRRADIALFEAKTTGRNRVVSAAADFVLARAG